LKHVYKDHMNTDMSYEDFSKLCRNCWQQKYGFLVIDKDITLTNGRYRKGFNEFAVPRSGLSLSVHQHWKNVNIVENKDIRECEKIVKEIDKTVELIHKKHQQ